MTVASVSLQVGDRPNVRILTPPQGSRERERHPSRQCEREGCLERTRDGKPFCQQHVDSHVYVQEVLRQLAERDAQDEAVAAHGAKAVRFDSVTAYEVILHLSLHGPRTIERLVREVNVEKKVLRGYLSAMRNKKLVTFSTTKRGATLVKLRKGVAGPRAFTDDKDETTKV